MAPRNPVRSPSQLLMMKAVEKLQDPKVRAQLVGYGRYGMKAAQEWQRDRLPRQGSGASVAKARPGIGERVGEHFGQGRLERRVDNLRQALAELEQGRPGLAQSLEPVSRAVDDVAVTLRVASALPLVRRKKAHLKIDGMLDRLETGLFEATIGSDPGSSTA